MCRYLLLGQLVYPTEEAPHPIAHTSSPTLCAPLCASGAIGLWSCDRLALCKRIFQDWLRAQGGPTRTASATAGFVVAQYRCEKGRLPQHCSARLQRAFVKGCTFISVPPQLMLHPAPLLQVITPMVQGSSCCCNAPNPHRDRPKLLEHQATASGTPPALWTFQQSPESYPSSRRSHYHSALPQTAANSFLQRATLSEVTAN